MSFSEYNEHLQSLMRGEVGPHTEDVEIKQWLEAVGAVLDRLRSAMRPGRVAWLEWVQSPERLAFLIASSPARRLCLPLEDMRLLPWLAPTD